MLMNLGCDLHQEGRRIFETPLCTSVFSVVTVFVPFAQLSLSSIKLKVCCPRREAASRVPPSLN